ncbi:hypothetical protein DKK75_04500 [Bifidobacterium asteroides]|uniref:Uncharacterized protein n=1 Tax=Bifidobacterium asteroides TaxID=1684 RepID=A0A318MAD1_9BIFI|nr:hypothetical protein DKK75_04500 [Bifidobacterium asteroides]
MLRLGKSSRKTVDLLEALAAAIRSAWAASTGWLRLAIRTVSSSVNRAVVTTTGVLLDRVQQPTEHGKHTPLKAFALQSPDSHILPLRRH